jgi:hypothetical protein
MSQPPPWRIPAVAVPVIAHLSHEHGVSAPTIARAALLRGLDGLAVEDVERLCPPRRRSSGWNRTEKKRGAPIEEPSSAQRRDEDPKDAHAGPLALMQSQTGLHVAPEMLDNEAQSGTSARRVNTILHIEIAEENEPPQ